MDLNDVITNSQLMSTSEWSPEFKHFSKLPRELRQKILSYLLVGPDTIKVDADGINSLSQVLTAQPQSPPTDDDDDETAEVRTPATDSPLDYFLVSKDFYQDARHVFFSMNTFGVDLVYDGVKKPMVTRITIRIPTSAVDAFLPILAAVQADTFQANTFPDHSDLSESGGLWQAQPPMTPDSILTAGASLIFRRRIHRLSLKVGAAHVFKARIEPAVMDMITVGNLRYLELVVETDKRVPCCAFPSSQPSQSSLDLKKAVVIHSRITTGERDDEDWTDASTRSLLSLLGHDKIVRARLSVHRLRHPEDWCRFHTKVNAGEEKGAFVKRVDVGRGRTVEMVLENRGEACDGYFDLDLEAMVKAYGDGDK